ncbi:hypothetical protein TNCV_3761401 [Trichonephila clavipes]|nr:hypothetical protein TNCV_3761401 [Trichonephila clavipes]
MTINKSQGQTMSVCGLDLRTPCFSHGQLYVACSRVAPLDVTNANTIHGGRCDPGVTSIARKESWKVTLTSPPLGIRDPYQLEVFGDTGKSLSNKGWIINQMLIASSVMQESTVAVIGGYFNRRAEGKGGTVGDSFSLHEK